MIPDLIVQLEALGGMWTGAVSQWGSYEIYTPLCDPDTVCWCTPTALACLIDEWRQQPPRRPPMRVWLGTCDAQ